MSEQTILEIMEACNEISQLAKLDVEVLYRPLIEARPDSGLSVALEEEIRLRAMRRMEGAGA